VTKQFELSAIDKHFAEFICRKAENASPWLELAASLLSNAVCGGHVCLPLAGIAGKNIQVSGKEIHVPEFADLKGCLETMPVVGPPGTFRPLVLDERGRLYL
jgi:exodeoxyribonuclease V alpha subunit